MWEKKRRIRLQLVGIGKDIDLAVSLPAVGVNVVHNNDRDLRKLQRVVLGLYAEESQRECRDVQTSFMAACCKRRYLFHSTCPDQEFVFSRVLVRLAALPLFFNSTRPPIVQYVPIWCSDTK